MNFAVRLVRGFTVAMAVCCMALIGLQAFADDPGGIAVGGLCPEKFRNGLLQGCGPNNCRKNQPNCDFVNVAQGQPINCSCQL